MDNDMAARIIQSSFREWRANGPLSRLARRRWLIDNILSFPGHPHLKQLVRRSAHQSPAYYLDPQADLDAIRNKSATMIQQAWRSCVRRSCRATCPSSRSIDVMAALGRMGSVQLSCLQITLCLLDGGWHGRFRSTHWDSLGIPRGSYKHMIGFPRDS